MKNEPNVRNRRWGAAVFLASLIASGIGVTVSAATLKIDVRHLDFDPIKYSKKVQPQLPASCPGLKKDDVKFETRETVVNGKKVTQHVMVLGLVGLKHDVRRDGSIHNPRTLFSTHPCFEANAKNVMAQWKTEPQNFEIRDAGVKIPFIISAASLVDLKTQLSDYLQ